MTETRLRTLKNVSDYAFANRCYVAIMLNSKLHFVEGILKANNTGHYWIMEHSQYILDNEKIPMKNRVNLNECVQTLYNRYHHINLQCGFNINEKAIANTYAVLTTTIKVNTFESGLDHLGFMLPSASNKLYKFSSIRFRLRSRSIYLEQLFGKTITIKL